MMHRTYDTTTFTILFILFYYYFFKIRKRIRKRTWNDLERFWS